LPKKIEFQLLLTDLALQFGNARARRRELPIRPAWRRCVTLRQSRRPSPRRPTAAVQRLRAAGKKAIAPRRYVLAAKPQLARQRTHVLTRHHPIDDRDFELAAEYTRTRL
jgi:hypothetical protein